MSKNFEQAYKELAQSEIPDLWDRIEAGLKEKSAPAGENMQNGRREDGYGQEETAQRDAGKEEQQAQKAEKEKDRFPIKAGVRPVIKILKRYSGLAAAAVCAAVVIPAALLLGRNMGSSGMENKTAEAASEESAEAAAEEIAEESAESAVEEAMPEEGMEADAETGRDFNAAAGSAAGGSSDSAAGETAGGSLDAAAESAVGESFDAVTESTAYVGLDTAEKEDAAGGPGAAAGETDREMAAEAGGKNADEGAGDLGSEKKQQSIKEKKEPVQGTAFDHVMIEVTDILSGKNVQEGTWYTVSVKEDPSGYLEAEEQITVFAPVYSSLALIEGETFEVDLVYEKGDGYSFVLAGYHGKIDGSR